MSIQKSKTKTKNGGPYTKQEQEKRRNKVYELYFEKGHSAIKISEELGVNRNTVNSDIKFLLSQVSSRLGEDKITGAVLTQMQRLEIQRQRLLCYLDQKDFQKTITVEKILLEVEGKMGSMLSRLGKSFKLDRFVGTEDITEEEISKFVRYAVFSTGLPCILTKSSILEMIISYQKCDLDHAENVFDKLLSLGLALTSVEDEESFELSEFAQMRGYISSEENTKMREDRRVKNTKMREDRRVKNTKMREDRRIKKLEKKYRRKFGSDKMKWPKINQMND